MAGSTLGPHTTLSCVSQHCTCLWGWVPSEVHLGGGGGCCDKPQLCAVTLSLQEEQVAKAEGRHSQSTHVSWLVSTQNCARRSQAGRLNNWMINALSYACLLSYARTHTLQTECVLDCNDKCHLVLKFPRVYAVSLMMNVGTKALCSHLCTL